MCQTHSNSRQPAGRRRPIGRCSIVAGSIVLAAAALPASSDEEPAEPNDMILIKGGSFHMGDVFEEGSPHEKPVHEVTVSDFHLGRHEVTVEQFRAFVGDSGYVSSAERNRDPEEQALCIARLEQTVKRLSELSGDSSDEAQEEAAKLRDDVARLYQQVISLGGAFCAEEETGSWDWSSMCADANWRKPGFEQGDKDPVTCVSWNDAVAYCNWLSRKAGLPPAYDVKTGDLLDADGNVCSDTTPVRGFRLPTEAEWEYAAREGGRKVRFGNGQDVARSAEINFNAAGDHPHAEKGEFRKRTTPVGSFAPNRLGLHDMAGNVWEWCSDYARRYTDQSQVNPYGLTGFQDRRAARGGRWGGGAGGLRISARMGWIADDRCNNIGFRVARTPS